MDTIDALCKEAGLDPTKVAHIDVKPWMATFTVYSVNIYGELMVTADHKEVVTHWVKVPVW